MNLLEPWILVRLIAGLAACLLFARGAFTSYKVLRHFDVQRATEGQLALEKQVELGGALVRIGAIVQVLVLLLSVLGADRMSRGVRGAMCAYGVFGANEWGFRSLFVTGFVALCAGVLAQVYALDCRVRTLELARPLAFMTLVIFPLSVADLACTAEFLGQLDLSVVASCCSVELDPAVAAAHVDKSGPRVVVTAVGVVGAVLSMISAWLATRVPTNRRLLLAGVVSLVSFPSAVLAIALEVAPHVFEVPQHVCPFCLLRADAYAIGYPLLGAVLLAAIWGGGVAASALVARAGAAHEALAPFCRRALRLEAIAWGFALVLAALPVVKFTVASNGASLFHGP